MASFCFDAACGASYERPPTGETLKLPRLPLSELLR